MVAAVVLLLVQVTGPAHGPATAQGPASVQGSNPSSSITGTVRDLSGSIVPGATVSVRQRSQRSAGGERTRRSFTLPAPTTTELVLIVRAGGFAELASYGRRSARGRPSISSFPGRRHGSGHRHGDAQRAAHRRRAGQRQRARPPGHPAVARGRRRRRAAADADVQPVPPHEQPVVASDGAGRVAARHRAERRQPHARAARRRAVQRSVRRLGVLDARAARERRSHRGRGQRELEPVRQLRDGRRHQHRDRRPPTPQDARGARRSTATATRPKVDFVGERRLGQGRRRGRRQRLRHRRLSDRRARASAARSTTTRRSTSGTSTSSWTTTRPIASSAFCASATSARTATTARRARSTAPRKPTTRRGRRVSGGVRLRLPDQSDLQATRVRRLRDVPQQLPRGARGDAAAQHRPHDAERRRVPTNGVGGMAQWSRGVRRAASSSRPAPTGAGWTATARRTGSTRTTGTQVTLQRVSGGTQRSVGAFVQDVIDAGASS